MLKTDSDCYTVLYTLRVHVCSWVVCMGLQECMEGWLVVNLGCHSSGTVHIYLFRQVSQWPWTQCVGKTVARKSQGSPVSSSPALEWKAHATVPVLFFLNKIWGSFVYHLQSYQPSSVLYFNLYLDASTTFSSEPGREGKINSHGQLPFVCFNFVLVCLFWFHMLGADRWVLLYCLKHFSRSNSLQV